MMEQFTQTKCPVFLQLLLVCAVALQIGCHNQSYTSPDGYDLRKPQKLQLGKVLNEISGITYNNESNTVLGISDSKEKIFEMNVKNSKLKDYTDKIVPQDSDLEDIVKVNERVYLLSSRGVIYEVIKNKKDSAEVQAYPFWSTDLNDFETLYYDASVNGLIMVCKACLTDKGKQRKSAYRFDLDTRRFDSSALFFISTADVRNIIRDNNVEFDPSAAAIHPMNKRLYILSSAGNVLMITDNRGKVIEGYHLNPDDHPQAEGLSFAPNGDMYIANEGKFGRPTLQIFHYQKGKNN